ncbi:HlyD family efflux transporter periplasmic adaptor subunit [Oscillatoria acuminata]|uniref:ABC exporter membrane fusion protein, DevB family n=1 Tax=Oscillatoria acuminata PCC 6304 TaxID=56110 RepID=K9TNC0_9CYAN|nr:HlyD family efflux transporter periplasmic adaptor subunit [Oscillatoria acuminata]AFY83888.1 ABC exporter membrane fusion protein, DevB family [Oscillatoria acuminata PCC 6304]
MGHESVQDKDKKPDRQFTASSVPVADASLKTQAQVGRTPLERVGFLPPWVTLILVIAAIAIGGYSIYTLLQTRPVTQESETPTPIETPPTLQYVSALGRVEPGSQVIQVSAPNAMQGDRLGQLLIEEGDRVRADQTIAILDSRDRLAAQLEQAKQQVKIAQAKLAQVKAGAKSGDIAAQEAAIARLQAQIPRDLAVQDATIARLRAQVEGDIAAQGATVDRFSAQLEGNVTAREAGISRLQAELQGQILTQEATIARLQAELTGQRAAQQATISRLEAQIQGDRAVQQATIARLQAEREERLAAQQAVISQLQAKLENAGIEFRRYEHLYLEGGISASVYDTKRLDVEVALQEVKAAQARLEELDRTTRQQQLEAIATLEKINETGAKLLEEARATLTKIEGTVGKQIEEARTNLQRVQATAAEQLQEEQAVLTQLGRTGQAELSEAEVKQQQLQKVGREQLNEAVVTRDRIRATGEQELQEARSILESISEVRTVDVQLAEAEVDSAIAVEAEAQARLDEAYVRSPIEGRVLAINTRPGESITQDQGIVAIAQTDRMFIVAEVYETDIRYVRLGQRAAITSQAVDGELLGTVDRIGLQIGKKDVLETDPTADTDARVVEVKIRLDPQDSERVSGLTNLQVEVIIATMSSPMVPPSPSVPADPPVIIPE